jgi:hypothetical protein
MPKSFSEEAWVRMRSDIIAEITSREGEDRHLMVLALHVVAHTMPLASSKKYNDNFIVASQTLNGEDVGPFQYFMEAMQHYGYLASTYEVDEDGNMHLGYNEMRTWSLTCRICGTTYFVANKDVVEQFRLHDRVCKRCR